MLPRVLVREIKDHDNSTTGLEVSGDDRSKLFLSSCVPDAESDIFFGQLNSFIPEVNGSYSMVLRRLVFKVAPEE